jgi:hypothetical protein
MAKKGHHTSESLLGGKRVHDPNHKNIGWVDKKGDVHKTGDTGTLFSKPKTIGHVGRDGKVKMGNPKP